MQTLLPAVILAFLYCTAAYSQGPAYKLPVSLAPFEQHVHRPYTTESGLPDNSVTGIGINAGGRIVAVTAKGTAQFDGAHWQLTTTAGSAKPAHGQANQQQLTRLSKLAGPEIDIRAVAQHEGEFAVGANTGLYLGNGEDWRMALPQQGMVRWAPVDVRAVAFDEHGMLWFASPQGLGCRVTDEEWKLFTGKDGLPYSDFTCIAAGPKGIWFGTTNGAILYREGDWLFRQGRRWLLDNHVNEIAVDAEGNAWIATSAGVSCIAYQPMTLAEKAAFFEDEIERFHRRTDLGYVNPAKLSVPGDKSTAVPNYTDNDGQRIGLYLGAVSLGYAATGSDKLKNDARKAFPALAFLGEVTQGGTHPAPEGFFARAVIPANEQDPNPEYDLKHDLRRRERDALWKIIQPRWPVDETGKWYWMCDGSADELDGHYFGYATYFDLVCRTDAERDAVRDVVRRTTDHLIEHGYNIVDYDGTPTRWGRLSPDDLNRNEAWVIERGLRSFATLTYLSVAHHITGEPKYRKAYLELALEHGYGMNGMTQPKDIAGPGTFGHGDDKMAFINYYHLVRYETDSKLLSMYYRAINRHWQVERYERCPWANFIYAACCLGKVRRDQWGEMDLTPPLACFEDAIDTLRRYPLDLLNWPMSNTHRTDMVPLQDHLGHPPGTTGHRVDGYVFPIDERTTVRWGEDPYLLESNGDGARLSKGVHYLLAYYMGLAHGFIRE